MSRQLTSESISQLANRFGCVRVAAITKTASCAEARRLDDRPWDRLLTQLEEAFSVKL